jgi:CRISPR-associated protein Csd2
MTTLNRREYVAVYNVINSNPNGDPDNGNQPRVDSNGYGLITDVSIKRKIRDFVQAVHEMPLLCQSGVNIHSLYDGKTPVEVLASFWDARLFGAVITKPKKADKKGKKASKKAAETDDEVEEESSGDDNAQVSGPIQFGFAKSVLPINPEIVSITSSFGRKEEQTQTMGNKWIVNHAVYVQHAFFNPIYARNSRVTAEDMTVFEEAFANMFELSKSAGRADCYVERLYRIDHDSVLGKMNSYRTTRSVDIKASAEPTCFEDYTITVNGGADLEVGESVELSAGVKITRVV